jgi:hypothetical protein
MQTYHAFGQKQQQQIHPCRLDCSKLSFIPTGAAATVADGSTPAAQQQQLRAPQEQQQVQQEQ